MARRTWTDDMHNKLVAMAGEGSSADSIASSLGVSARDVLGHARRWRVQIGDGEQKHPKWTQEEISTLEALVAAGKTAPAIAEIMGRSNTSIWARCHAMRLRPANSIVNGWSDEDIETLRRMAAAGCRSREVATKLGRTRERVLSKAHDIGVSFRIDARPTTLPRINPVVDEARVLVFEPGGVSFFNLDFAMQKCRRPLWSDGATPPVDQQTYCGKQTAPGSSWCPDCATRMSGGFLGPLKHKKVA